MALRSLPRSPTGALGLGRCRTRSPRRRFRSGSAASSRPPRARWLLDSSQPASASSLGISAATAIISLAAAAALLWQLCLSRNVPASIGSPWSWSSCSAPWSPAIWSTTSRSAPGSSAESSAQRSSWPSRSGARAGPPVSAHVAVTRRREASYWFVVLCAVSLATSIDGLVTQRLNLGYAASGLLFSGVMAVIALAHRGSRPERGGRVMGGVRRGVPGGSRARAPRDRDPGERRCGPGHERNQRGPPRDPSRHGRPARGSDTSHSASDQVRDRSAFLPSSRDRSPGAASPRPRSACRAGGWRSSPPRPDSCSPRRCEPRARRGGHPPLADIGAVTRRAPTDALRAARSAHPEGAGPRT